MNILLTGATGFVGRAVAVRLATLGCRVLCLVRDASRAAWMQDYPGLESVGGDLQDLSTIVPHLGDAELVVHLAGLTKGRNGKEYYRVNGRGTANLLDAIRAAGKNVRKILYVSSLAVAGPHTSDHPATEDGEVAPLTDYGASKLVGERYLRAGCDNIPWTILRPPAVYGPYDRDLFLFFKMAKFGVIPVLGNGAMELSLIHVVDLAAALTLAAFTNISDRQIYYLSDGRTYTIAEMAKTLAGVAGGRVVSIPLAAGLCGDLMARFGRARVINSQKIREANQPGWVCDTTKIAAQLGFRPTIGLADGFAATYRWYMTAGWL